MYCISTFLKLNWPHQIKKRNHHITGKILTNFKALYFWPELKCFTLYVSFLFFFYFATLTRQSGNYSFHTFRGHQVSEFYLKLVALSPQKEKDRQKQSWDTQWKYFPPNSVSNYFCDMPQKKNAKNVKLHSRQIFNSLYIFRVSCEATSRTMICMQYYFSPIKG